MHLPLQIRIHQMEDAALVELMPLLPAIGEEIRVHVVRNDCSTNRNLSREYPTGFCGCSSTDGLSEMKESVSYKNECHKKPEREAFHRELAC